MAGVGSFNVLEITVLLLANLVMNSLISSFLLIHP